MNTPPVPRPLKQDKFELLIDFGEIIVPHDYNQSTHVARFTEQFPDMFYYCNPYWYLGKSEPPTAKDLIPGKKLSAQLFAHGSVEKRPDLKKPEEITLEAVRTTNTKERLSFLKSNDAVYPGIHGLLFLLEQKLHKMPAKYWLQSYDDEAQQKTDENSPHAVAELYAGSHRTFQLTPSVCPAFREINWDSSFALLLFKSA